MLSWAECLTLLARPAIAVASATSAVVHAETTRVAVTAPRVIAVLLRSAELSINVAGVRMLGVRVLGVRVTHAVTHAGVHSMTHAAPGAEAGHARGHPLAHLVALRASRLACGVRASERVDERGQRLVESVTMCRRNSGGDDVIKSCALGFACRRQTPRLIRERDPAASSEGGCDGTGLCDLDVEAVANVPSAFGMINLAEAGESVKESELAQAAACITERPLRRVGHERLGVTQKRAKRTIVARGGR